MKIFENYNSAIQTIVIADLYAKVGKDKMSFRTSSIFNIMLKLFLENCNHIVPKRLHRFCFLSRLSPSGTEYQQAYSNSYC